MLLMTKPRAQKCGSCGRVIRERSDHLPRCPVIYDANGLIR